MPCVIHKYNKDASASITFSYQRCRYKQLTIRSFIFVVVKHNHRTSKIIFCSTIM